ncbi:MAG: DUF2889 domain-containing protein [Kordiimonadaceae bacterium]|jgi:hypothetical protein|nr:DUF2889 domain-containing protein [Kordiimonadaceae bacterium]
MPLSASVAREKIHTRNIELTGYEREDGLWDIEAHMTDVKTYGFDNKFRGRVNPGDPIHEMWVRLTVDQSFMVVDAEAVTENHPLENCPNITSVYKELIGIRIGRGWRRAINEKVRGRLGCTHITELLQQLATVSFQSMIGRLKKKEGHGDPAAHFKPLIINTCHAWADDGEAVKDHFPDHYKGD